MEETKSTPLPIIANVSRVVTKVMDRIMGDRVDYPLMVAAATVHALRNFQIESRLMYGQVAWIEILEDQTPIWAGAWNGKFHFWVATQFGEVVDLNASVAHRKNAGLPETVKAIYSPPMLWSSEVPNFYRFVPEGIAELDFPDQENRSKFEIILAEIQKKCRPENLEADPEFPNEPLLCTGRQLLDDSHGTFKLFDRALAVKGLPPAPF